LALAKPKIPGHDNRCHPRPISGRPQESRPRGRPSVRVWREESNPPRMTTDVVAARSAAVSPGMGEESQGIGGGVRLTRRSRRRPTYLSWPTFAAMLLLVPAAVIGLGLLVGEVNRLVPLLIFLPAIIAGLGSVAQTTAASVWTVAVIGVVL